MLKFWICGESEIWILVAENSKQGTVSKYVAAP